MQDHFAQIIAHTPYDRDAYETLLHKKLDLQDIYLYVLGGKYSTSHYFSEENFNSHNSTRQYLIPTLQRQILFHTNTWMQSRQIYHEFNAHLHFSELHHIIECFMRQPHATTVKDQKTISKIEKAYDYCLEKMQQTWNHNILLFTHNLNLCKCNTFKSSQEQFYALASQYESMKLALQFRQ